MNSKTSEIASSTIIHTPEHSHEHPDVSPILSDQPHHPSVPPSYKMNTENMRAILIKDGKGPVENLYIGETAVPTLQSGEVLVKARTYC